MLTVNKVYKCTILHAIAYLFYFTQLYIYLALLDVFSCTDIHTDILWKHEQAFAHILFTYIPIGLHTNICSHTINAPMCTSNV